MFEPVLKNMIARKQPFYIACFPEHIEFIKSKLNSSDFDYIDLSQLRKKHQKLYLVHRLLAPFIIPRNFSWQYHKKINMLAKTYGFKQKVIFFVSRFFPKVKGNKVNHIIKTLFSPFVPVVFPTEKVVVASLNRFPELLCSKKYKVYTITESWDHCVKWPNGYPSDVVFTWNKDLAADWNKYQGDKNILPTYPLKLRYAIENIYKKNKHEISVTTKPKCMYAVASTRIYSVPKLVNLEYRIIGELCKATQLAGWDFHIKPRPSSDLKEFEAFKVYDHVTVGYSVEGGEIPANYYLDDVYNKQRFEEAMACNIVINCFTTFGLDAALAGIPVMQLDLRQSDEFIDSNLFYENHHIKHYLINKEELLYSIKPGKTLKDQMVDFLSADSQKAISYSQHLRNWLIPEKEFEKVVDEITDVILK